MEIKTFIPEEIPGGNKTERGSDDMYFDERVNNYVMGQCEAHGANCNKCEHYPFCRLVDIYTDAVEVDLWAQYAGFDTTVNEADLAKLRAQMLPYVEVGADASPDEIGNYEMDTDVFPPEPKFGTNPQRGTAPTGDPVNHPQHYAQGGVECIDVMVETQGKEAVMAFCICNAMKYIWRHSSKNGIEDVRKAKWYIDKYLDLYNEKPVAQPQIRTE